MKVGKCSVYIGILVGMTLREVILREPPTCPAQWMMDQGDTQTYHNPQGSVEGDRDDLLGGSWMKGGKCSVYIGILVGMMPREGVFQTGFALQQNHI